MTTSLMTEDACWALVDKVGWKKNYNKIDSHIVQLRLAFELGPQKSEFFFAWEDKKQSMLYTALDKFEKSDENVDFGLGDDSFGDLIAHIVGCGKDYFEAVLANPKKALKLAQSGKFGESFSYCVPSKSVFKDVEHLPVWHKELTEEISQFKKVAPIFSVLFEEVQGIIDIPLQYTEKEAKAWFNLIDKDARECRDAFVGNREQHAHMNEVVGFFTGWSHRNYVSDMIRLASAKKLGNLT